MKKFTLSVEIGTTDNAVMYDVRLAVEKCLHSALFLYADTSTGTRPHRLTGAPVHTFGYAVALVRGVHTHGEVL